MKKIVLIFPLLLCFLKMEAVVKQFSIGWNLTGNWGDPNNWVPAGVPTASDDVFLTDANIVILDVDATAGSLTIGGFPNLPGAEVYGSHSLTINGAVFVRSGGVDISGSLSIGGSVTLYHVGFLKFPGDCNIPGSLYSDRGVIGNPGSGGTVTVNGLTTLKGLNSYSGSTINGKTVVMNGGGLLDMNGNATLTLQGGGKIVVPAGKTVNVTGGDCDIAISCCFDGTIENYGTIVRDNGGALRFLYGVNFYNYGSLVCYGPFNSTEYVFNDATGLIEGASTLSFNGFTNNGTISPGVSNIGTLGITGNISLNNLGIQIEPGGGCGANLDLLNITGNLTLANGILTLSGNTTLPNGGFVFLTWTGTRTGNFSGTNIPPGFSVIFDDVLKQAKIVKDLTFSSVKPTCYGGQNGKLTVNPTAPITGYTYLWNTGATTRQITNLPAGTYNVTVTKTATGCSVIGTGTLTEPTPVTISLSTVDNKCFGQMQGKVSALASGGTGTKTYLWNTGSTSFQITNLSGGDYSVTATDAKGCTAAEMTTVNTPTQLVLNHTVATLANGKFKVTLSASGGTPYTTAVQYRFCKVSPTGSCAFTTTSVYSNLLPGTHTFKARDKNACETSIEVTLPPSLMMNDELRMMNLGVTSRENASFNIHNSSFIITPNPFDNQLVIAVSDLSVFEKLTNPGHLRVRVFDAVGRLTALQNFPAGSESIRLETQNFLPGVYQVQVLDSEGRVLQVLRAVK